MCLFFNRSGDLRLSPSLLCIFMYVGVVFLNLVSNLRSVLHGNKIDLKQ